MTSSSAYVFSLRKYSAAFYKARYWHSTHKPILRFLGYNSGEDADVVVMGCDAVWTGRQIPTFRINIMSFSTVLKIGTIWFSETGTVCFSKMFVYTYGFTWRNNPEGHPFYENLIFILIDQVWILYGDRRVQNGNKALNSTLNNCERWVSHSGRFTSGIESVLRIWQEADWT